MKNFKFILLVILSLLCSAPVFAQSFYRPWSSYNAVKPKYSYKRIDTLNTKLRESKCFYQGFYYEPNQIITNLNIHSKETFKFFKSCCAAHPSKCVSDYVGTNNKTLLYTLVENRAYEYMRWILNEGFEYDSNIDNWGMYKESNDLLIPIRNYNPMMLACKKGDFEAIKILRERGSYLSSPENDIGFTPYQFAIKNPESKTQQFLEYIEIEYNEEIHNIKNKKQFGKYFDVYIIRDLFESIDKHLWEYQKIILEQACFLNKA